VKLSDSTQLNVMVERLHIAYGDDQSQFGELRQPPADSAPIVVLVHGGFWRRIYGLDLMDPLAADLVGRGVAVWNVEYRRVGQSGGGWPGTLTDVAAAVDLLAAIGADHRLDVDDVAVVGHSAGGHLALWLAGRQLLPGGAPGSDPVVTPRVAVGLAPVADLAAADRDGVGSGAVGEFLGGGFAELPDRYAVATPAVADGVSVTVVRGSADDVVPAAYTIPPGDVTVVDIAGDDHFDLIDPASRSWAAALSALGLSS
jgi:acetyl esterase/lipase